MQKSIKYLLSAAILSVCATHNTYAQNTAAQPQFLILKIAEYPQQNMAENTASQNDGIWDKTKEVSSDVWDGTKEVSSDVWDGAKKVSGDVWDGAKEVGSDVKDGLSDDGNQSTENNNKTKK